MFGQRQFEMSLAEGSTIDDFLETMIDTWGDDLASRLFEPDGSSLLPHIGLMVNGRSIRLLNNLETILQDGDEILLLPPVGGG